LLVVLLLAGCARQQSAPESTDAPRSTTGRFPANDQGRRDFAHALENHLLDVGLDARTGTWSENGSATLCVGLPSAVISRPMLHQLVTSKPMEQQAPALFQRVVIVFGMHHAPGCYASDNKRVQIIYTYTGPDGWEMEGQRSR
jgi:hypothetical protein